MTLSSGSSQGTPGRGPRLLSSGVPARFSSSSEVSGRKQLEIAEEAEAAVASVAIATAEEAGEEVAITPVPRGKMTPLAPEKKHWIKRLWKLSWPYTHVRVVLSLIPVVLSLLAFLLAYLKWPEADVLGPKVWVWALSFLILSMSVIITALVISGLLFVGSSYWASTNFFLYLLNIRGPGVFLVVAVCGLAIDIWWLTELSGDFDFYYERFWIALTIIAATYLLRRVFEHRMVLKIARNNYGNRLVNAMFEEKILYKIAKIALEARKAEVLRSRSNQFARQPTFTRGVSLLPAFRPPSWDELARMERCAEPDAVAYRRLKKFARSGRPDFLGHRDAPSVKGVTGPLAEAYSQQQQKDEIREMAQLLLTFLDRDRKGYLTMADFAHLYPDDPHRTQQVYLVFSAQFLESIVLEDLIVTVKRIYNQRVFISRGLSDRADIAQVITQSVGFIYWTFMLVVVLLVFDINFDTVVLPYISLLLAFSFAFGGTLKTMLDAAVLILAVHPFDIGDRIHIGDLSSQAYFVERITLFRTEVFTPDGRNIQIPNTELVASKIINIHRSKTYTLSFSVEMSIKTSPEVLRALKGAVIALCIDHEYFCPDPMITIDTISQSNAITFSIWISTKTLSWSLTGQRLMLRSDFLEWWCDLCLQHKVTYEHPLQPTRRQIIGHDRDL